MKYLLVFLLSVVVSAQERREPNRGGSIDLSTQDPAVALKSFKLPPGYKIELFASEKDFPTLANPVAMTFDSKGRLWVSTMPSYPQYNPPNKPNDKIVILEDTDADGKADSAKTWIEGLHLPTGFEIGAGGVWIAHQPNMLLAKDTDGDDRADEQEIMLHGLGTEDSHHAIHAFIWGPDGGLYIHEGTFHASQVETPKGVVRLSNAGAFRLFPRTWDFSVFVSYPFANPWGHVWDYWGQNFIADASGGNNYFGSAISGHVNYPDKHVGLQTFIKFSVRPTAGCQFISSRHFPNESQGNFIFNNTIGFQGIKQYKIWEDGSGFNGEEIENLLESSDPNFRPVAMRFAPDGSLYIVDWFNPLVGHMQYSLRDERRDHSHGRIWRITYPSRPLVKTINYATATVQQLLDALKEYEDATRYFARRELNERKREEVTLALKQWVGGLPANDTNAIHHKLEALWVYQTINVVNSDAKQLLDDLLNSPEPRARAAATRALRFWIDKIDNPLALLQKQIVDPFARVRMEALLTLSFFKGTNAAKATEIALQALEQPLDYYINYVLGETIRTLSPNWKPLVLSGQPIAANHGKGLDYLLNQLSLEELAQAQRGPAVFNALLRRPGVSGVLRKEALAGLSRQNKTTSLSELTAALQRAEGEALAELSKLLAQWNLAELRQVADVIDKLRQSTEPGVRQAAAIANFRVSNKFVGLSAQQTLELLRGSELLVEPNLKDQLFNYTLSLLTNPPARLNSESANAISGRFIRIELPGDQRTMNLAEVQVFSGSQNIALKGKATQSTTTLGGSADKAIDGRTVGDYSAASVTHTEEDKPNTWWEVDLGHEQLLDRIIVWPRTDSGRWMRLENFRLLVLDSNRKEVFRRENNPAPRPNLSLALGGPAGPALKLAAIEALAVFQGHDAATFAALAPLLAREEHLPAVITAISKLDKTKLPTTHFAQTAPRLADYAASFPLDRRNSREFAAAADLAEFMAASLPSTDSGPLQAKLKQLRPQIFTIRTIAEQMRYDITRFYVEAGRPVEIQFENPDILQHNLVIVEPGAMQEVGMAADVMGSIGFARQFIPDTKKVRYATRLLGQKGVDTLRFIAPSKPADYPYICTFPAHWLVMNGIMSVVPTGDPKAGQTESGPIAPAQPSQLIDILALKGNVASGKAVFERACITCHKLDNKGAVFGPELAKVGSRLTSEQILESIVNPSAVIPQGSETVTIEMFNGEIHAGLIQEETPDKIALKVGGEAVQTLFKGQIKRREVSKTSAMPIGFDQALNKQELADLVALLSAMK